jgi:hypothetical protein
MILSQNQTPGPNPSIIETTSNATRPNRTVVGLYRLGASDELGDGAELVADDGLEEGNVGANPVVILVCPQNAGTTLDTKQVGVDGAEEVAAILGGGNGAVAAGAAGVQDLRVVAESVNGAEGDGLAGEGVRDFVLVGQAGGRWTECRGSGRHFERGERNCWSCVGNE